MAIMLCFQLYFQLITQRYTVEASSIHSPWKIRTIPVYKCRETIMCYHELTPWDVSMKNETQRRTKVSVYILHTAVCQKEQVGLKRHQILKKSGPSLAIIKLCLSECIGKSGSQSAENFIKIL